VSYTFTLIPGDGIGSEIIETMKKVLEHSAVKIEWENIQAGMNLVNPSSIILDHIVEFVTTVKNKRAVANVIAEGKFVTRDSNPNNSVSTNQKSNVTLSELDKIG
jgi:isocitrate/isopropylmalate dehydrogenase